MYTAKISTKWLTWCCLVLY